MALMSRLAVLCLLLLPAAQGLAAPKNRVRGKALLRKRGGLLQPSVVDEQAPAQAPVQAPAPPPVAVVDEAARAALRAATSVEVLGVSGRNTASLLLDGREVAYDTTTLCQRDDEAVWLEVRRHLNLTASEFDAARDRYRFASRADVLARKARLPSAPPPFRGNEATRFGLKHEPRAVEDYARATGAAVSPTGLWTLDGFGASPDGLVVDAAGSHGLLEVKTSFAKRHKAHHGPFTKCPRRFYAQIQGQLAVCDREWCDLVSWIPRNSARPNYAVLRVHRDRDFWDAELRPELDRFAADLAALRRLPAAA